MSADDKIEMISEGAVYDEGCKAAQNFHLPEASVVYFSASFASALLQRLDKIISILEEKPHSDK